jgi:hypothetical protein
MFIELEKMETKIKNTLISSFLLIYIMLYNSASAQRYFLCDSSITVLKDSTLITSHCHEIINIKHFPEKYHDTLWRSDKNGKLVMVLGLIEFKGKTKNRKGVYRVYYNGKILEECEFLNYLPHGWYKRYAVGFNQPPKTCLEKTHFINGLKHGKSIQYLQKTRKKFIVEKYYKGQLIKKVERFEKWD